jgi:hypothetical protein
MMVISGFTFPSYNWFEIYHIVCIYADKPNRSRSIALSVVAGYPTGEV